MAQPKSRLPLMIGLVAAGGAGYYLYSAGGSPKVAEKQFESDLSKASAKVKSEIPGRTNQAQKEGEKYAQEAGKYAQDAGAKLDSYVEKTKAELVKAEGKLEAYSKDAKKDAMSNIDAADKKILEESAKAKSGISSWFGGK